LTKNTKEKGDLKMANVIGAAVGGTPQRLGADTVGDVRAALSLTDTYVAMVNGDPAEDEMSLEDEDYVSFSPSVKGG
jgi:molybdopterin converting factor small subunit